MSLIYEWFDENQYLNTYIPYNEKNGKVNVYLFDNTKNEYIYKFCYYIPLENVPENATIKSTEETAYTKYVRENEEIKESQKEDQNNMYLLTLQDGTQQVLDQSQTITYVYTVVLQLMQNMKILESSLIEANEKNEELTKQLETQKQVSGQLYISNQKLSDEYYKLQQQRLMKNEQNNINRRNMNLLNHKNNSNITENDKKKEVTSIKNAKEEEVDDFLNGDITLSNILPEGANKVVTNIKNKPEIILNNINISTNEECNKKNISWVESSDEENDNKESDIKKSYAEMVGFEKNGIVKEENVYKEKNKYVESERRRKRRERSRQREKIIKNNKIVCERKTSEEVKDGWEKVENKKRK